MTTAVPASHAFNNAMIDVFNSIRLIAHNSVLASTQFQVEQEGPGDRIETMISNQCVCEFKMDYYNLEINLIPAKDPSNQFERVCLYLDEAEYHESQIFQDGGDRVLEPFMIRNFTSYLAGKKMIISSHALNGREYGYIAEDQDMRTKYVLGLMDKLLSGIVAKFSDDYELTVNYPSLGAKAAIFMTDYDGNPAWDTPPKRISDHFEQCLKLVKELPETLCITPTNRGQSRGYNFTPLTKSYQGGFERKATIATANDAYDELKYLEDCSANAATSNI